jgi:hypothetical protein
MSEPGTREPHPRNGATLERDRQDVLKAARPLPQGDDVLIEDLTDDEDRIFLAAIFDA